MVPDPRLPPAAPKLPQLYLPLPHPSGPGAAPANVMDRIFHPDRKAGRSSAVL